MTYGIGLKELWEVEPAKHQPGYAEHTIGWPLVGYHSQCRFVSVMFKFRIGINTVAHSCIILRTMDNPWLPSALFSLWTIGIHT
jgi:electron-transferring-flavoprotein dehydrogenase